jgi:hypothetical protein
MRYPLGGVTRIERPHNFREREATLADDETPNPEDFMLNTFVAAANAGKGSVGITLWVGGTIVSGATAGVAEFFDGVAEEFDAVSTEVGSDGQALGDVFRMVAYEARKDVVAAESEDDPPSFQFIHLKNAKAFSPGSQPIPTNRGVWWRGRLDAVDGWCFGELSVG